MIWIVLVILVMVFGPVIGYISQYNMIQRTKSLGSFSIDICAILLIANILRLFFWYSSDGFATALVFQSMFMIGAQVFHIV